MFSVKLSVEPSTITQVQTHVKLLRNNQATTSSNVVEHTKKHMEVVTLKHQQKIVQVQNQVQVPIKVTMKQSQQHQKVIAKPILVRAPAKSKIVTLEEQQQVQVDDNLMSMGLCMDDMNTEVAANALLDMDPTHDDNLEMEQNEQNTVLVSKNMDNIIMTEDGQIIIRDINDLYGGNNSIELNFQVN